MKRILLFTMALWLSTIGWAQTKQNQHWVLPSTNQQEDSGWNNAQSDRNLVEVFVGDSLVSNSDFPLLTTRDWAYSQTLLHPEDINSVGLIHSISLLKRGGEACAREIMFFLKLTELDGFYWDPHYGYHIQSMSPDDLLYQGTIEIPEGDSVWVTIPFDHPFLYDGTSNVIVCFFDHSGWSQDSGTGQYVLFQGVWLGHETSYPSRSVCFRKSSTHPDLPDPYDYEFFSTLHMSSVAFVGRRTTLMKFVFDDSGIPELVADPNEVHFSEVPIGAWKHSLDLNLTNSGYSGILNSADISGSSFIMEGPDLPIDFPFGACLTYRLTPAITDVGEVNETVLFDYSEGRNETLSVPVTANGYSPHSPDVFEMAADVDVFPYSDTPTQLHNTYWLPGDNEDGPDAAYKLTFEDDVLLNASVVDGDNPKIALYKEDFDGEGGPHTDNAYSGPALPDADTVTTGWLYYDTDQYWGAFSVIGSQTWAVKFTPEQLAPYQGCVIDRIGRYRTNDGGNLTLTICMGGEDAPGQMVSMQKISQDAYSSFMGFRWEFVTLDEPVLLDVTQNLWLCFYTDDLSYGAVYGTYCGDPNSCWVFSEGTWTTVADINDGVGCSWMIRAFATNEDGSREINQEGVIDRMTVEAGTYYLVASSTTEGFQVNINPEAIPLPEAACNPTPADGASDLMASMKLKWNFGTYTTGYRLLFGTTNPPQEVAVDWTDVLDTEYVTGLLNNRTHYYWRVDERNSSGITEGPVWSFTTKLVPPTGLVADHDKLYEGDAVILNWEAPSREASSYNVYQNDVLIGNTVTNTYTADNLGYNMNGHSFAVQAVYDEGLSTKTDPVRVYVTGLSSISGIVTEQDRVTPIEGVTVKVNGLDELGFPQLYLFTTDSNGSYQGELYAGKYKVSAMKEGYQTVQMDSITFGYSMDVALNFFLEEAYATAGLVVAEDLGESARITWQTDPLPKDPEWIYYDNDYYTTNVGYSYGSLSWGVSFPDMSDYAGMSLTKIAYYDADAVDVVAGDITVNIYFGNLTSPQRLVSTQGFSTTCYGKFIEVELSDPVDIDGTEPLWIICHSDNISHPASACGSQVDPNGRWASIDGVNWVDILDMNPNLHCTWMLRGYLEDPNGSSVRSLQYYNVYRSNANNLDGAELIATEVIDTLFVDEAWDGFASGVYQWGVSKVYQGNRLFKAARSQQILLSEGFEGGSMPEGWTQFGGSWNWAFAESFQDGDAHIPPHSGNYAAYANSDGESGLRNLVTPAIDLTMATSATLDFWYVLPDWDGDWDDLFVKYSDAPDGPWTTLWTAPSDTWNWTEASVDLTELCGGVVYLNFAERDYWGYGGAVDDVAITADVIPAGFDFQALMEEGFEGGSMPEGWTQFGGSWNWAFAESFQDGDAHIPPHSGNYAAYANSDGESGLRNLVTPAIDLTMATSATLDFWYVLPDWDGDWDDLFVKYSDSPDGPWTTLWTAPSETWSWTEASIDLTELCGEVVYLDFAERDYWGYGGAVDDVTVTALMSVTNQTNESTIVWSNPLDKDMVTTVDVKVLCDNAYSPEGTQVSFINLSEPGKGYDYEVTLDDTGSYRWDEFRKGTYLYSITHLGYQSCADGDTIEIWESTSLECLLEETLRPVEDLYVSPTGWAQWVGDLQTDGDGFHYGFEDGTMGDWTLIDADGDGYEWKLGMAGGTPSIAGYGSTYCVYSESYDPAVGGLYPDNYLVSKRVLIGNQSVFSFYVCAQDEDYPHEHYGVAVSTIGNTDPVFFTTIWEETLTAKDGHEKVQGPRGASVQGTWYYKEIDLSAYAGQEVYIALRHFGCYDMFVLDVDDIRLSNGRSSKNPMGYKVKLDGVYAGDVSEPFFLHDESRLVPYQTYVTSVAAVYATAMSDYVDYTWTYIPCDEFEGAADMMVEVDEDNGVLLHWTLPELTQKAQPREGQWYYYDDGVCIDAIGTEAGLSIYWAVMFPAGTYQGNSLTKVSMFDREGSGHEGIIMIYQGGTSMPGQLVYTQPYATTGANGFVEFELDEPVAIDDSRNLWVVMNNTTGTFVASCAQNSGDSNGRWISMDGMTWEDVENYNLSSTWMLRAYLIQNNVDGVLGTMVWRDGELLTPSPIQGNSFTDPGLDVGGYEYCIRVVHDGMPDSTYYAMSCALCEEVLVTPTNVNEDEQQVIAVYPNPTRDGIVVKAAGMRRLRVVNSLGQLLYDREVSGDELPVAMGAYGPDIYVIQVTTTDGVFERRVIVTD